MQTRAIVLKTLFGQILIYDLPVLASESKKCKEAIKAILYRWIKNDTKFEEIYSESVWSKISILNEISNQEGDKLCAVFMPNEAHKLSILSCIRSRVSNGRVTANVVK